ncbi:MAG: aspartate aminotransferase family protein [Alphaproteobacteria bacterium]
MFPAVLPVYSRIDLPFERGEGCYLYTTNGERYLDFASGIAVNALGHSHPYLVNALKAQAEKLWHVSNLFNIPLQQQLAERLVAHSFADTVFFCNSGAEAWECGVKIVRRHFYAKGEPHRHDIIVIEGNFHGRTMGAISASEKEKMITGFAPLLPGFPRVPFDDIAALRAAITPQTAGICMEPVLGEGGVKAASVEYLQALRAVADEFGLLLFLDEVQCGMGRTGKLFAHEWAGIVPDVMSTAKAIGGGFPLGACLATAHAASGMVAGTHGSTYGGNPLAMAVGHAVLDVMLQDNFMPHVLDMATYLNQQLADLVVHFPNVLKELRGKGLMAGVQLQPNIDQMGFIAELRKNHLLAVQAADHAVRLFPALIIEKPQIDEAITALKQACLTFAA